MDLYIFCVVLGAAGMAAMAFLGFTSSHGGSAHTHAIAPSHSIGHGGGHAHGVSHAGHAPAETLEAALMSEGRAVTGFDSRGNGLISLELGGEVVQVLGTQLSQEHAAGVRIRAGDVVRIEEVDGTRNRCTVSRIGLGEAESRDADRL